MFNWKNKFIKKEDAIVKKVAIVGSPNVGKSVLFNNLTGAYATVSNYPGTTVEVSRGTTHIGGDKIEIIDTPGMYSMLSITEEERVARNILFNENPSLIIHVIDAKNLERMLPFTLQLTEAGLHLVLVLNVMDEAERLGLDIDINKLSQELGIPVVATVSTTGKGINMLKAKIEEYV
jgi:ferrous iron transport protein B